MSSGITIKLNIQSNSTYSVTSASGNFVRVDVPNASVYVFGSPQNKWFYDSNQRVQVLEKNLWSESFYRGLNGHFALVIVSKTTNALRLVTNRIGGSRLYISRSQEQVAISNNLVDTMCGQVFWNPIACKETFEYRWTSGDQSLIEGIQQVPPGSYWDVNSKQEIDKHTYFYFPMNRIKNQNSIEEHAKKVEALLTNALDSAVKPNSKIGVLLSGGVDSSILSAIARTRLEDIVAISHRSDDHLNPELETAVQFARELGIEHRIVTVNDDAIRESFIATTRITGQPPRNQSALILNKIFQTLDGHFDQIVYGEAADTLFGSSTVNRFRLRHQKQAILQKITAWIPFSNAIIDKLPEHNKLRRIKEESVTNYMLKAHRLRLTTPAEQFISELLPDLDSLQFLAGLTDEPVDYSRADLATCISLLMTRVMRTGVANHFHEIVSLAHAYGTEIISPFADLESIDYGYALDDSAYFGGEFVKPVLRKIGEKYFTPSLMYLPKQGFPTPYVDWLNTLLDDLWQDSKRSMGITTLEFENDSEFKWTHAAIGVLQSHFELPFAVES